MASLIRQIASDECVAALDLSALLSLIGRASETGLRNEVCVRCWRPWLTRQGALCPECHLDRLSDNGLASDRARHARFWRVQLLNLLMQRKERTNESEKTPMPEAVVLVWLSGCRDGTERTVPADEAFPELTYVQHYCELGPGGRAQIEYSRHGQIHARLVTREAGGLHSAPVPPLDSAALAAPPEGQTNATSFTTSTLQALGAFIVHAEEKIERGRVKSWTLARASSGYHLSLDLGPRAIEVDGPNLRALLQALVRLLREPA